MKIEQLHLDRGTWISGHSNPEFDAAKCQLVLAFGEASLIKEPTHAESIRSRYPSAHILLASSAGEIINDQVLDNSIVVTAIQFDKTAIRAEATNISKHANSHETGLHLMERLHCTDLNSVLVISDGIHINGSELVQGLNENNPGNVPVTGGLAGDGTRFTRTFVGLNGAAEEGLVVAVGFYGNSLQIGHGSFGGWDEFGPERTITRSEKNVLHEIDQRNALDLYKEYLGPYKEELPGSALLFPLAITEPGSERTLVRTILTINEEEGSMLFAGNMTEGSKVRLMKANFDRLIEGSSIAARNCFSCVADEEPELALFISCVGRKIILQDRTDEEVEAAKSIFRNNPPVTGFYSYGEISPFSPNTRCELHNQTMTITTLKEI